MLRSLALVLAALLPVGLSVAACGDDPTPAGAQGAPPPTAAPTTDPPPDGELPDGAAPPEEDAEPPWVWEPPVVPTSSAACGGEAAAIPAGTTFTTPAGRTFHVYGPSPYDPNVTYPVVLTYHGWYANGPDFRDWFRMDEYVESRAFVVYPDSSGPTWDLAGTRDLEFFDEMVAQLGSTYCINPARVFALGFSYGGKFANHLGCKRAGWVKAISVGGGSWGGDGQRCGRLPVLVTHRTHDPDELIAWGRTAAANWGNIQQCGSGTDVTNEALNCTTRRGCLGPGDVTFCEDTFFDASWPSSWNHTVREPYRAYTWQWFDSQP